ncbi:MAG: metal-sensitive transcriptional regulator [Phycisphaerales bacterium]|nr:metal-sensitive transcriptional regulator [Phycisphaerales bacterium]
MKQPSKKPAVRAAVKAAACPCGTAPCGVDDGPGRRAVAVEPALKAANITRLRRAEGQVRGIAKMVEDDRYCTDVIVQIAAAQESLRAVAKNLLKNHLKHCARAAVKAGPAESEAMCDELMDVMSKLAR